MTTYSYVWYTMDKQYISLGFSSSLTISAVTFRVATKDKPRKKGKSQKVWSS